MSDSVGIEIEWLGGNCPVQAEGTFDGVPFYFRARGTSVRVDVGDHWTWDGPMYEWPEAGWISEDMAHAYISEAYADWVGREEPARINLRERRLDNGRRDLAMQYIHMSVTLERALGADAEPAVQWLKAEASALLKANREAFEKRYDIKLTKLEETSEEGGGE